MSASQSKVVRAYLEDAEADLEMARLGANAGNRLAAYHLQQAAEKLVKALRVHHELRPTASHDIGELVEGNEFNKLEGLPTDDPWRSRLLAFDRLTAYATTFRYPSPTAGKRKAVPVEQVRRDVAELEALHSDLSRALLPA